MKVKPLNIAMLSLHSSPIGALGTQDTGGMSVYVRELGRWLGDGGHRVDIFTCVGDRGSEVELYPNVRLVCLDAGLKSMSPKTNLPKRLPLVFESLDRYRQVRGLGYDVVHSHYWLSGVVGGMAGEAWRCPHVTMFHTLAARKNRASALENEPDARLESERRLVAESDRIVVPVSGEGRFLAKAYGAEKSRINIIPAGVDTTLFQPADRQSARRRLKLPEKASLILYVGRFAP